MPVSHFGVLDSPPHPLVGPPITRNPSQDSGGDGRAGRGGGFFQVFSNPPKPADPPERVLNNSWGCAKREQFRPEAGNDFCSQLAARELSVNLDTGKENLTCERCHGEKIATAVIMVATDNILNTPTQHNVHFTEYPEIRKNPVPAVKLKYPRNLPCPCGSGKKYKHCCLNR